MVSIFYVASIIAVLAALKVISSTSPFSALLYLIISLLASAAILFSLGAYFSAALQILLFIGAIAVLFLAIISYLDLNTLNFRQQEKKNLTPKIWLGPLILIFVLFVMLLFSIVNTNYNTLSDSQPDIALFSIEEILLGPYILVIELAVLLILGAIVVGYHFASIITRAPKVMTDEIEIVFAEKKSPSRKKKDKKIS